MHELEAGQSEAEVYACIASAANELGFERCAFGMRALLPATAPKVVLINNYARAWQLRYRDADYVRVDPTVLHAQSSVAPLLWSDEVFASTPQLWAEAQEADLRHGWCQATSDVFGVGSLLTLARSRERITPSELAAKQMRMQWLASISHMALGRIAKHRLYGELRGPLTAREIEVLQWTVDGKTSGEIADILKISVDTVNFHVKNAANKLDSPNKVAAAVRALAMGLLA